MIIKSITVKYRYVRYLHSRNLQYKPIELIKSKSCKSFVIHNYYDAGSFYRNQEKPKGKDCKKSVQTIF
jgi:hypothetical protein